MLLYLDLSCLCTVVTGMCITTRIQPQILGSWRRLQLEPHGLGAFRVVEEFEYRWSILVEELVDSPVETEKKSGLHLVLQRIFMTYICMSSLESSSNPTTFLVSTMYLLYPNACIYIPCSAHIEVLRDCSCHIHRIGYKYRDRIVFLSSNCWWFWRLSLVIISF